MAEAAPRKIPTSARGRPLTSVPKQVIYTEADRRRLASKFDALFPHYRGLLRAQPTS